MPRRAAGVTRTHRPALVLALVLGTVNLVLVNWSEPLFGRWWKYVMWEGGLIEDLSAQFVEASKKVEESVEAFRQSNKSLLDRAKEAVDIYNTASGGSSLYEHVAIQRIQRDVLAVNQHAILHPDTNLELYGRILCGLEPDTVYI